MGLQKGQTNNRAGRPKGTPNKSTEELRKSVNAFVSKNWGTVQATFNELDPKDKLLFLEKMLQFTLPKLQSVQMDGSLSIGSISDENFDKLIKKITKNDK